MQFCSENFLTSVLEIILDLEFVTSHVSELGAKRGQLRCFHIFSCRMFILYYISTRLYYFVANKISHLDYVNRLFLRYRRPKRGQMLKIEICYFLLDFNAVLFRKFPMECLSRLSWILSLCPHGFRIRDRKESIEVFSRICMQNVY